VIPKFPEFKKIGIEDKQSIELYTRKYPPYSDFNFTSLWAWDTNDERMISKLNDNLVVRFTDYITRKPSFSFLGINELERTARELIAFAKASGVSPVLRFVPEESVNTLRDLGFLVEEDVGHFDYIFSISELANLKGSKFKEKRHSAARFLREYPDAYFELKKLDGKGVKEQIISVLHRWAEKKRLDNKIYDIKHEEIAINRLLQKPEDHKLTVSCIFLHDVMVGFSFDEILPNNYAISHFFKADNSYNGIYDFFNKKLAQYLLDHKVVLWNWEQDLGIEHIRKSKTSYHPVNFLKKYKVSLTYKK
jgi:hypothetical protein